MSIILALLGGWLKVALSFLKTVPWWVFAGIAAALLAWHLLAVHDRAQFNKGFDVAWTQQHQQLVDEQQSHAVTRTSLNTALVKIADQNAAVDKLVADGVTRQAASTDALKAAQSANKPREAAAKALDASAAKAGPRDAACAPSEAFIASIKEL